MFVLHINFTLEVQAMFNVIKLVKYHIRGCLR